MPALGDLQFLAQELVIQFRHFLAYLYLLAFVPVNGGDFAGKLEG